MPERWIRPACALLLAGAWILDLLTPQLFVAAILLNAPIALSSLALDYRFTRLLVALAIVANASAGYINGLADHGHWDGIAVGNRIISGLSFLVVGGLSIATQRSAARAGELTARQERAARERGVRRGIENIRASVNPELIERAIVREARESLGAEAAQLYVFTPTLDEPTTYTSNGDDVEVTNARPPAALSSLLHRLAEAHEGITPIVTTDALGRLLLDTLGAPYAVAAPLVEHETVFGVLLVMRATTPFEEHFDEGLTYYADQAAIALAQARLFVQLAERNDELAAANVALRERSDIIRDIVYALSHDLRTPLSAARMTMRQALDGAYGELPPAYRENPRALHRIERRTRAISGDAVAGLSLRIGRTERTPRARATRRSRARRRRRTRTALARQARAHRDCGRRARERTRDAGRRARTTPARSSTSSQTH